MKKFFFCLLLLPGLAWAGRPMVADDARVLDPGSCQLDAWQVGGRTGNETWLQPGCGFAGALELSLGAVRVNGGTQAILQAKTLFRQPEVNGWSWGLVAGKSGDSYAYVPVTLSMCGDCLALHVNAGGLREKATDRLRRTWAVGVESDPGAKSGISFDLFGQSGDKPGWQLGLRRWLVQDAIQLDASFGGRPVGGKLDRWLTFGTHLQFGWH